MNNEAYSENPVPFLTALFKNPKSAENVYSALLKKGYKKEDITLAMPSETPLKLNKI